MYACVSACPLVHVPRTRQQLQNKESSTSNRSGQLCDLDHRRLERLSQRRSSSPRFLAVGVQEYMCVWIAGRADEAETHGREAMALAAERTLSVTIHCLRQPQTRLLGNGRCFVSIALPVFLVVRLPGRLAFLSLFRFSHTLSPLHCSIHPSIHSLFCSFLFFAGISISSLHSISVSF